MKFSVAHSVIGPTGKVEDVKVSFIEGTNAIIERGVLTILGEDGLPKQAWNSHIWHSVAKEEEPT